MSSVNRKEGRARIQEAEEILALVGLALGFGLSDFPFVLMRLPATCRTTYWQRRTVWVALFGYMRLSSDIRRL